MKVSIQVLGSLGDVMPYVSIARALKAKGAAVSILAPSDYSPLIRAAGIDVDQPAAFTLSEWMDEAAKRGTLSGPLSLFRDWSVMISPHVDDVMARCLEAARGADIVVANLICAPARIAAEANATAFMLTAQQPVLSPTRHHPCAMVWRPWMGPAINRSSYTVVRLAQRLIGVSLESHRRRLGLQLRPALSDTRTHLGQPLMKVTSVTPVLIPGPPPDWTDQDVLTAYPSLHPVLGAALPSALEQYLADGPPPVYVGLGSLGRSHGEGLAAVALESLSRLGLRGIFLEDRADGRITGAGHFICGAVSHDQLFPRCAAILHHGGAGTVDTALRAGVPQLVQPHMLDQFWYAAGLKRIGVAGAALRSRGLDVEELTQALSIACAPATVDRSRQARALARSNDGADCLAMLVEREATRFAAARK